MTAPMTVEEWAPLTPAQKRQLWRLWTTEQRLAMYGQLAATTPGFALPYPDDYNDPADSPTAFRELALATDTALGLMAQKAEADITYVRSPQSEHVTDWNLALKNGFYVGAPDSANRPDEYFGTWWSGITIGNGTSYIHQIAWPFYSYNPKVLMQRVFSDVTASWSSWSRVGLYPQSWGTNSALEIFQHVRDANVAPMSRFAHGMRKDDSAAGPTDNDEWRVQCYDTNGDFTWSAIKIFEDGIVLMPRGYELTAAIRSGEPVAPESAVTVGTVVEIVRAMLAGVTVAMLEASDDGTTE